VDTGVEIEEDGEVVEMHGEVVEKAGEAIIIEVAMVKAEEAVTKTGTTETVVVAAMEISTQTGEEEATIAEGVTTIIEVEEAATTTVLRSIQTSLQIPMTPISIKSLLLRRKKIHFSTQITTVVEEVIEAEAEVGEEINSTVSKRTPRHLAFQALKTSHSTMSKEEGEVVIRTTTSTIGEVRATTLATEEVEAVEEEEAVVEYSTRTSFFPLAKTQSLRMATKTCSTPRKRPTMLVREPRTDSPVLRSWTSNRDKRMNMTTQIPTTLQRLPKKTKKHEK